MVGSDAISVVESCRVDKLVDVGDCQLLCFTYHILASAYSCHRRVLVANTSLVATGVNPIRTHGGHRRWFGRVGTLSEEKMAPVGAV